MTLQKILTPYTLIGLNALIIVVTVFGGERIEESGMLHALAILFVIVAIFLLREFREYGDRAFQQIFQASLLGFLFLGLINVLEFTTNSVLFHPSFAIRETTEVVILLAYLLFFALSLKGLATVLRYMKNVPSSSPWQTGRQSMVLFSIISAVVATLLAVQLQDTKEMLIPLMIIVSASTVLFIHLMAASDVIANSVPILHRYINMYRIGYFLILLASVAELLEGSLFSEMQADTLSMLIYYAALSFMILGLESFLHLKGVYKGTLKKQHA